MSWTVASVPTLNVPQARFIQLPNKFRAFVGGFGSGKTWVGGAGLCKHFLEWPRVNAGYFAPTYPQIRDIFYPTIEEVAHDWCMRVSIETANKEVHFYGGGRYRGTVICRSMEKPGRIVGFKIGKALVDELDTLATAHAREAWRKIIARMRVKRDGLQNGIDVTTTPEGFRFVYEQFQVNHGTSGLYGKVHASTYENEINLPDDYIPSLFETYPENLVNAYLHGQFVNLATGSVYPYFDRVLNGTDATLTPNEELHIGMDFNVMKMAAVVCVIRDGWPVAVDELTGVRDTPSMILAIRERWPNRDITIYPDASGASHKSVNASWSDIVLLREAGFTVRANASNPPVRDRIVSVNAMLKNGKGERRLKVNVERCPKLAEALEQQSYDDNGQPDKSNDLDHPNDALGYFIHWKFPASRSTASKSDPDARKHAIRPFTAEWLRAHESEPKPRVW